MTDNLNAVSNEEKMKEMINRVEKCIERARRRKEARQNKELLEQVEKVVNG